MFDIYTERQESENWILQNDWYFNLYTGNEEFTEEEKAIIEKIDHAKITQNKYIETKYGLGTIRNLSSGCKTFLNVVKNPDKVISVDECGPNVLDEEDRRFINFEFENQYMLFLRNCDGLNLSAGSFTILKETEYVITLEREL